MADFKQAIIINNNIELSKGKMAAQAAHASLGAFKKSEKNNIVKWEEQGQKKIVLSSGENKLEDLYESAKRNKLSAYIVTDAGKTEVDPGTKTALAIGPDQEQKIDQITGQLELIK